MNESSRLADDQLSPAELASAVGGFAADDAHPPRPLFRPEAVEAAVSANLGRPAALLPLSWTVLAAVIVLSVGAIAVFVTAGSYSRTERAIGIVDAAATNARVSAPVVGTLTRLFVHEGERVEAGAPLASVSTERVGMDGKPVDDATIESLDREIAGLNDRLEALSPASELQGRTIAARLASLSSNKAADRAAEIAATDRLRLAQESLERMEPVAKRGFISGEVMRHHEEDVIALRDTLSEARSRQDSLSAQMDELRVEQLARRYSLIQQRGDLLSQIARARRDRAAASSQRGYLIKAAVGGVITALQVHQGQIVDQRAALMTVASTSGAVTAELYVPSRAIGFVKLGQLVRVRYDAFPYQRFGTGTGHIVHVSLAVLRPDDIQAAVIVKEPMYRVIVALDRPWIDAYGRRYPIQSGMAVGADIELDQRSFGAWLLDPLLAQRGRL